MSSSSSLSSSPRRFILKHAAVVDIGCGCRRRLRRRSSRLLWALSSFSRSLRLMAGKLAPDSFSTSASSSSATSSFKRESKKKRVAVDESVAVVKESTEPYVDFRESMVQMIVEEELYAWDDLNDLLHRFLLLNSPQNHHLILGAFADIWDGVFSPNE